MFVAALNGSVLGMGAEISWACDLRLLAEGDYFIGHPEVLLGFAPWRWWHAAPASARRFAPGVGSDLGRQALLRRGAAVKGPAASAWCRGPGAVLC
ncbi:hypothetical protein [Nocardia sp. NBC_01388]|uniref:hypothetical protein n=1 Tax=Nocardia sp. NBC_01388 TaxID=2903596 RepID=UPI0032479EB7